jgi:hypothetical protein
MNNETVNILSLNDHIMKIVNEESSIIKTSTAPIYLNNNKKPMLLGSGILLKIDSHYFLISAAHVLIDNGLVYYIPYSGDFYNISGKCDGVYVKENKDRVKDKFDFAILKLDDRSKEGLEKDYT